MGMPADDRPRAIVFVDDEQPVLRALQRVLRSRRDRWSMHFVDDPAQALALVEQSPVDVVVADMRMPGMDGAQLLARIKERAPATIRMILSGYTDLEATLRVVPVAHQFLTKPVDGKHLAEVIERSLHLRDVLQRDTVQRAVSAVGSLPVLPEIYQAISDVLANPASSVADVADIIAADVAMSAKILQLVNSAFFGIERRITDVRHAVAFLGMPMVRQMVLVHKVLGTPPEVKVAGLSLAREREHALLCAQVARALVPDTLLAADAYLAAALHDIGKLVMAAELPEEYAQILATAQRKRQPLHLAERDVLGTSHAEIGAYLLGLWGLPDNVIEAVAFHHRPRVVGSGSFDLLAAVHIANHLVQGEPAADRSAGLDMDYLRELGVVDRLPEWRRLADRVCEAGLAPRAYP
jgi:HD-like signal output (HDOD) protein